MFFFVIPGFFNVSFTEFNSLENLNERMKFVSISPPFFAPLRHYQINFLFPHTNYYQLRLSQTAELKLELKEITRFLYQFCLLWHRKCWRVDFKILPELMLLVISLFAKNTIQTREAVLESFWQQKIH